MGEIGEHFRDLKAARKAQESQKQSPPEPRCWDWIVTSGSCHYARDRSSFKTYRPVNVTIGLANTPILGVGSVELEVKKSPSGNETGRIVLHKVIHMPSASCNGFIQMMPADEGLGTSATFTSVGWQATTDDGVPVWYAERFRGLMKLVIAGNPSGQSWLDPGKVYSLSLYLSPAEMNALGI